MLVASDPSMFTQALPSRTLLVCCSARVPVSLPDQAACLFLGEACSILSAFNRITQIFDRFEQWYDALRQAAEESLSYHEILACTEAVADSASLFILDPDLHTAACSPESVLKIKDVSALSHEFHEQDTAAEIYSCPGLPGFLCKNLFQEGHLFGRAVMTCTGDRILHASCSSILNQVAERAEALYRRIGTLGTKEKDLQLLGQQISRLLRREIINPELVDKGLIQYGWTAPACYRLILVRRSHPDTPVPAVIAEQLQSLAPQAVSIIMEKDLVLLARTQPDAPAADPSGDPRFQMLDRLMKAASLQAGLSRRFSDIYGCYTALLQAQAAIKMGRIYSPSLHFWFFDDYAFHWLLRNGTGEFSALDIGDPALGILKDYDLKNQTELSITLYTYLRMHCSATAAARELYVARSSLLKRIRRIQELTGIDFSDFWRVSYLLFSYALRIAEEKAYSGHLPE